MSSTANDISLPAIKQFLYHEADLLDSNDLGNWMELFTDDGTYWMPIAWNQQDPHNHISILYENRAVMAVRASNFQHQLSASMAYDIRSSHLLGNIRLIQADGDELTVKSNFQAVLFYKEQTVFAGSYTHQLRRNGNSFKIRQKRVDLINCNANHRSILTYI